MSGPIVRTGASPEFWENWQKIFGPGDAPKGKNKKKSSATPKPAAGQTKAATSKAAAAKTKVTTSKSKAAVNKTAKKTAKKKSK